MNIFTINISEPLQISQADGLFRVAVKARGGTVTILGDQETFTPSVTGIPLSRSAVTLEDGQGVVYQAAPTSCIEILITPGTGTADVELFNG